jgi:hypothetical protein
MPEPIIKTECQAAWDYHADRIPVPLREVAAVIAEDRSPGPSGYGEEEIVGVFRLKDGRFLYVSGGCDTTGWDCQSSAFGAVMDKLDDLVRSHVTNDDRRRLNLKMGNDGIVLINDEQIWPEPIRKTSWERLMGDD